MFDEHGADAWYERPIEEFLPDGPGLPEVRRHATFERERDILDVWFDSGSSHEAVLPVTAPTCRGRPTSTSRAATSTAAGSRARCSSASARAAARPTAACVTHGFFVRRAGPQDVEVARQHDRAAGDHQEERRRDPPAVGVDGATTARRCASARRSWRAWSRPTASCATRCASWWRTSTTSTRTIDAVPRGRTAGARSLRARALRRRRRRQVAPRVRRLRLPGGAAGDQQLRHRRT